MKKALTILLILFSFTQSSVAKSDTALALNGLKQTVKNVDYLAKVKITKVEISHEDDESEKQVYFADVIETYKGDIHKSAPVYVALCLDNKGRFYWPGTGSEFKYSSEIDTWLTENKTTINDNDASGNWCE